MSRATRKLLSRNKNKGEKDGGRTAGTCDLDEEMEKVFAMSNENDKFDLSRFSTEDSERKTHQRYNEREINSSHRRKSYPHIHLPLKSFKINSSRRVKSEKAIEEGEDKANNIGNEVENSGNEDSSLKSEKGYIIGYEDSLKEPTLSDRVVRSITDDDLSADKHVQFCVGSTDTDEATPQHTDKMSNDGFKSSHDYKPKRKYSHHYKKSKKYMPNGDGGSRNTSTETADAEDGSYQFILQLEEPLKGFMKDDLTSHRFDSSRDKRRFSTKANISSVLNKRGTESSVISSLPLKIYKKNYDHSPHEVFVQLDELTGVGEDREWKETARWIKYEEDVEEGADRWGRPHVASLSFHSLLNLRRCIETGAVLLDLEEKELPGVAYRVVEQMVVDQVIKEEEKSTVIRALLLRHRHVCELHEKFRFIRRNTASYTSLQGYLDEVNSNQAAFVTNNNLHDDHKGKNKYSSNGNGISKTDDSGPKEVTIDMKEETYASSCEDLDRKLQKEKESILKRIPPGAEATTVLVGTVDFLQEPAIAFVRLAEAILLPTVTEVSVPVRFMFILLGPPKTDVDYHEIGRSMSTLMSNSDFHKEAYRAAEKRDLLKAINEFLDYSIVLPPDNWERDALLSLRELRAKNEVIRQRRTCLREEANANKALLVTAGEKKKDDDPLKRTKKCFGGLINDIKRRVPYYKSDFVDGLNYQCISAAIFMFFAALSAAITFGGLFAKKTMNRIGISETLISTSLSGIVFGLLSSQPLMIIGTTGPLLLFDESLFKFCNENNIDYLTMRLYIGFWIVIIALLVASVEGSVFIKVFTRFTEEIFATLISLIYIFESVTNLILLFSKHPLMDIKDYCNDTINTRENASLPDDGSRINQPNTALFCLILSLGTFFLAYYLRHFRNSKFLGRSVRRAVGDFGVPISIVVFGVLDAVNSDTYTEKLSVPKGFEPSLRNRGWLILPGGPENAAFPKWAMLAASLPAFLVYILVFMETNISELIIGKKERKLKKGNGFHLDIVLVCLTNAGCGMIGAPWMCAASVRSVTHVNAVTVMSTTHAPGDKPYIIQVREQRVSALITSALVGVSVLMASILGFLPMAVLFGVFLYMGISSIQGIQFFERLILFLMPVKHHPQTAYVRKVPTYKMYLFTLIQLFCVIILWTIKSSSMALLFPFFLLLLVPLRAQLIYFFTPGELKALDSDEPDAMDEKDDEPDFYAESLLPG